MSKFTKNEHAASALRASLGVSRDTFLIGKIGRYDPPVGDAGEIIGDSRSLCPPRDAKALFELILVMHTEWAEKPDDWAERRTRCIQHIKDKFSIERMVSAYENCWFGD